MSIVTVTTEQVHELIQQLAAMTSAASITPEIVANIFENMRQLNDQERAKVIATAEAYIAEIQNTGISAEKVLLDDGTTVKDGLDTLGSKIDGVVTSENILHDDFVQGGINDSTGEETTSTSYYRSATYYELFKTKYYRLRTAGAMMIFFYDSNQDFISGRSIVSAGVDNFDVNELAHPEAKYFRFVIYVTDYNNKQVIGRVKPTAFVDYNTLEVSIADSQMKREIESLSNSIQGIAVSTDIKVASVQNSVDAINDTLGGEIEKELTSDDFCGFMWNGSAIANSQSAWNGFLFNLDDGDVTLGDDIVGVWNILTFATEPSIGTSSYTNIWSSSQISEGMKFEKSDTTRFVFFNIAISRWDGGIDVTINKNGVTTELSELSSKVESMEGKSKASGVVAKREGVAIAFIFDDNFSQDFLEMFDERGLKVTFAPMGNVDKENQTWKSDALVMSNAMSRGHGTCAHGVVKGLSWYNSKGISTLNDRMAYETIEGENKAFDDYELSHRGLVKFNDWADTPHTWAIVSKYYDYLVAFGTTPTLNSPTTHRYKLARFSTDSSTMLDTAKTMIDDAIKAGNKLIIMGGHANRTGQGGSYSTMADFEELLDYVESKVNDHSLMSMSVDDGVDFLYAKTNLLEPKDFRFENPSLWMLKVQDNAIKLCSVTGNKACYRIEIGGSVSVGSFKITLGANDKTTDTSNNQILTIDVASGDTITDVINTITEQIFKAYTVRKTAENAVTLYRDIEGVTFDPFITDNVTDLVFSVTKISSGSDSTWV